MLSNWPDIEVHLTGKQLQAEMKVCHIHTINESHHILNQIFQAATIHQILFMPTCFK